ncbi:ATP-binding protein [Paenibacillus algorifonticola]|uniref:sensor histidine kinase n=1 Tax=Paenibacillus algorifonticola TaxID=684063 RepID=UPI003D281EDA
MKLLRSRKLLVFLFLSGLFALVGYLTVVIISDPFIGIVTVKNSQGEYLVESLEPAGQAVLKGIQLGDIIDEVNGKPARQNVNIIKFSSVERVDSIVVSGNTSEQRTVTFNRGWNGDHTGLELLIQLYIPWASLLLFLGLSTFLYRKRKNDSSAIMLILFFLAIGISYFSSAAAYRNDLVGVTVMYAVIPFVAILFLLFMNMYLRRYSIIFISPKLIWWLAVAFSVVSLFCLVYIWTNFMPEKVFLNARMVYHATLIVGNFICVYQLFRKFFYYRSSRFNSLFKITLSSHLVAFTPFTTMNLLPLLGGNIQILPAAFTAPFLFVLPIVYFYLLTSNQLFDVDFILTRFKYYTLLSLLPALIVTLTIAGIVSVDTVFSWVRWLQIFIVSYVVMTLFLYSKEQIDHKFRPKLFKAMYSYQDSLDRFSRKIARVMKRDDLEMVLKEEIGALLPASRIDFLIVDQIEAVVKPVGEQDDEQSTAIFLLQVSDSLQVGEVVELPHGLGLVIGCQKSKQYIVWIGSKTNHTRFNSDELRWLKTLANYASIVFENLYLIESLIEDLESEVKKEQATTPWILRLLFCLSENERRKLAADLHDSALQDQLLWYRRLEALMLDHPITEKLEVELDEIKEGLLDVIHQIRETCNELRPPLLKEMGIVEALESIIEHTQMRNNFAVDFRAKPFDNLLNEEQITAIYRIVQELLRNADKHARANLVTLELEQRTNMVYFHYKDDGVGMDVDYMEASFEHMGLSGIKERVASLEGEITFRSKRGKGLEVIIILPQNMTTGRSERGLLRDSYLIS